MYKVPTPPPWRKSLSLQSSARSLHGDLEVEALRQRRPPPPRPVHLLCFRMRLSWAPEQLPHPASPKRPDALVLGTAAGQGRPDRLQCQGLKAANKISLSIERKYSGELVSFVTVFTTYNSDPDGAGKMSSDVVTVGKHSYSKVARSMAILNTFVSFVQGQDRKFFAAEQCVKSRAENFAPYALGWREYNLKYMKASCMLGDQLALAWVVKSHLPSAFGKFSSPEIFQLISLASYGSDWHRLKLCSSESFRKSRWCVMQLVHRRSSGGVR